MNQLTGIAASHGIAIGKAYLLAEPDLSFEHQTGLEPAHELNRLEKAIETSKTELEKLRAYTKEKIDADHAEVFSAHLLVLKDPELLQPIRDEINDKQVNAESALHQVATMLITMFSTMENEYMRERAADIRDVTDRIMAHLLGAPLLDHALINEEVIIVAKDLTPSDTVQLNPEFVQGFVTDIGGGTSHSAIMAQTLNIPAIVGTKAATQQIKNNDLLIVDGISGEIFVNPSETKRKDYEQKQAQFLKTQSKLAIFKHRNTVSRDQKQVKLLANIGTQADI